MPCSFLVVCVDLAQRLQRLQAALSDKVSAQLVLQGLPNAP